MSWANVLTRIAVILAGLAAILAPLSALAQASEPGCRPEMASWRLPIQRVNLASTQIE